MKTQSTEQFIIEAKEKHGNKYDYSKVVYENNLKEVIIICDKHGEFQQLPKTHKRGNGCKDCGREKTINGKKSNTNKFINKSKEIHGDKYDYSKVEYKKANEKVIIICDKHGDFLQKPNSHLSKEHGCRKCSTEIISVKLRKTTNQFIEDSIQIHGDTYDYSKVEYKISGEKVIIICKEHGEFLQTPNSHLSKKSGCIKCSGNGLSNTEDFIKKSKEINGDTYDYSKVEYKNAGEKVIIICKEHGEFEQKANNHLNGQGCYKCGYNMFIFSNNDFINKAKEIHNDKYDYSKINYIKMNEKVIIICKEHGNFEQTPSNHITHKHGCQICANNYLSNTTEFIEKAITIHRDNYDYSKVNYVNNRTQIIIICKKHGEFEQQPDSHLCGSGCKFCGIESMKTKQKTEIDDFIKNANIKHNNKYDYSKINYINARTKIIIICKKHGEFEQQPDSHLRGCGCIKCSGNGLSNTKEFIEKAITIHKDKYDYSKVNYIKSNEKIIIICKEHGEFMQPPANHLYGNGCNKCNCNYSKPQIVWLNFTSKFYNINIAHMENEGEYKIPTTNYHADGYCKENNTIYEFHGDFWHGNPIKYNENDYNSVSKKTFGELYKNTLKREQLIRNMGYNLVIMWEHDWNNINKSIKILQRKFRSNC